RIRPGVLRSADLLQLRTRRRLRRAARAGRADPSGHVEAVTRRPAAVLQQFPPLPARSVNRARLRGGIAEPGIDSARLRPQPAQRPVVGDTPAPGRVAIAPARPGQREAWTSLVELPPRRLGVPIGRASTALERAWVSTKTEAGGMFQTAKPPRRLRS